MAVWIDGAAANGVFGFDFEGTLWRPGLAIRDGLSPYPAATQTEVEVGNPALYPPFLMLAVAPLTVLPWSIGVTVWAVSLLLAVVGALYLLGVRDPACYGLALASAPVLSGLIWGNATLLLVLAVALAWRWRDSWLGVGIVVGVAIAAKLFLWPLLLWLLGSRRYRAFAMAIGTSAVAVFVPWALLRFDGLAEYPALLDIAEDVYAVHSYSVSTMLSALGVATDIAVPATLALGGMIACVAFVVARRGLDDLAISIAVLAAVLGSPIVWEYYYALVLVPLAIARPALSWPWAALILFYLTHSLPRPLLKPEDLEQGGSACCPPRGVPLTSWAFNHAPAGLWPALGAATLAAAIVAAAFAGSGSRGAARTSSTV